MPLELEDYRQFSKVRNSNANTFLQMIHLVTRWGAIDVQINNNIEILNNAKEVAIIMTIQATQSIKDIMTKSARP